VARCRPRRRAAAVAVAAGAAAAAEITQRHRLRARCDQPGQQPPSVRPRMTERPTRSVRAPRNPWRPASLRHA
jgi:hypothetical protein